jgi:hypothetical protein
MAFSSPLFAPLNNAVAAPAADMRRFPIRAPLEVETPPTGAALYARFAFAGAVCVSISGLGVRRTGVGGLLRCRIVAWPQGLVQRGHTRASALFARTAYLAACKSSATRHCDTPAAAM